VKDSVLGRIAYAALFVLVLPAALVLWARGAAPAVTLPAVHALGAGLATAGIGVVIFAAGAWGLIARGGGLPLNAFPPPRLVRGGVYRWIRNPMYIGFGLACAGVSIAVGSAAGLWLVTPSVGLGAAALVFGFERHDLARRFGVAALAAPLLSLPRGDGDPPTPAQRIAVFLWVFLPWLILYYAVQALGRPADAFGTILPFERRWPVWPWTEALYASAYLFIPLTVLVIRTGRDLRRFAVQSAVATAIVGLVWLVVPVVAINRPFSPTGPLGRLLAFEQGHSRGVAAFPAFHVLWTLLAAEGWSATRPRIGWTWATLITLSCLTTGMHTVIEVGAALLFFVPLRRLDATWALLRGATERLANSWKEWRVGPVRFIVHGVYAAAAAGVGILVAGMAAGPRGLGVVTWIGVCILLGAGLWAQALEGSSRLLRPFGWYGGVAGGVIGAVSARLAGAPILPALAAFAIAAPWIQILGRLRCLVQGCCHGGAAPMGVGIVYRHRRSRVTQLAQLAGVSIHATPVYSIAGNIVIGLVLARLRVVGATDALLVGSYLILGGTARFVEESYRAEPQTPVVAGLHIYQWIAIASVVIGAFCTTFPSSSSAPPFAPVSGGLLAAAVVLAVLTGLSMGMDFPGSNRRFSRLAPAD
jgi:protein-S-isoprenylcysteine O-methyltransferase Ste14